VLNDNRKLYSVSISCAVPVAAVLIILQSWESHAELFSCCLEQSFPAFYSFDEDAVRSSNQYPVLPDVATFASAAPLPAML